MVFIGMVAKNPKRPVLIPTIGIVKSFTNVMALKIVPSPPMLINNQRKRLKPQKYQTIRLKSISESDTMDA